MAGFNNNVWLFLCSPLLQTHEFFCIQSEPNLCDPGPVGGATFPQRQHQPAGHSHGRHWQTGSHDILGLRWGVLTQKRERDWRWGRVHNTTHTRTVHIKKITITAAGIKHKSFSDVLLRSLQKIVKGLCKISCEQFKNQTKQTKWGKRKRLGVGKCILELNKEKYPLFSIKDLSWANLHHGSMLKKTLNWLPCLLYK